MSERRAKLFKNGGSQAVRLPKEFQFSGNEVRIRREGQNVVLEPVGPQIAPADLERVKKVMLSIGPKNAEFAGLIDEAMKELEGDGQQHD